MKHVEIQVGKHKLETNVPDHIHEVYIFGKVPLDSQKDVQFFIVPPGNVIKFFIVPFLMGVIFGALAVGVF